MRAGQRLLACTRVGSVGAERREWVWNSFMSVDDGIAEREQPASRTPIDGSTKGAIRAGRLLLREMPVNTPVPATAGNTPKPGVP